MPVLAIMHQVANLELVTGGLVDWWNSKELNHNVAVWWLHEDKKKSKSSKSSALIILESGAVETVENNSSRVKGEGVSVCGV